MFFLKLILFFCYTDVTIALPQFTEVNEIPSREHVAQGIQMITADTPVIVTIYKVSS